MENEREETEPMGRFRHYLCVAALLAFCGYAAASPYRGVVTFGGQPLPGATVTATQGAKTLTAVSDQTGAFAFDDLADGQWAFDVEMQCFEKLHAEIAVAPNMPPGAWALKLLSTDKLLASAQIAKPGVEPPPAPTVAAANTPGTPQTAKGNAQKSGQANVPVEMPKPPDENPQSADGFLVQGSVNNAATSQYATNAAFGNTRAGSRALYTGGFTATEQNSALDARTYALSGIEPTKPAYNDFSGTLELRGPIRIPHVMPRGPDFYVRYQWSRSSNSSVVPGLLPTEAERSGDLSGLTNAQGQQLTIYNPATGAAYVNNQVPVTPQAAALLKYFPAPNLTGSALYNYQAALVSDTHTDSVNSSLNKQVRRDYISGWFGFQSTRSDSVNLFDFVDRSSARVFNGGAYWHHQLKPRISLITNYSFNWQRKEATTNFENRENVSGDAGIGGNDQDPANWGPPSLGFSSGFFGLSDGNSSDNRYLTNDVSVSLSMYMRKHNITVGGDFRKQDYNWFTEQNPRGSFTFNGTATAGGTASGSDLADFLIGIPDASSIAYGNADKYFREPAYSLNFNDDWRLMPVLTINAGVWWGYSAPITELHGRLVNLDASSGFAAVAPVLGSNPVGPVTGAHYPSALMRPDRSMIQPRIGVSWRPIPASTVVIKAGYGIYSDTSVYQNVVLQMAQQAPLSTSLSAQNSAACPLSLATFTVSSSCAAASADTFGIDRNFHIGYLQSWQLSVQRDLPFALQATATYIGMKGTHGPQEILPNSYPLGEANPCPSCTSGFMYEGSGGNSFRNAGQFQLRRRMRSGFTATLMYTYAKSIDDDAYLGGQGGTQSSSLLSPSGSIAQDWLNPRAERARSNFDQRHLVNLQAQYTSGMGLGGGTLLGGWRGRALKEWTVLGTLSMGTGLPETPSYPAAMPGTGFSNIIRPSLTGAPIYASSGSTHLNAAAFTAPTAGGWGTAGRNSITGPNQFSFNSSMARTFRPSSKTYLDVTVNSTNTFNHATISGWNTTFTNPQTGLPTGINSQFGQPIGANPMRSLQITTHLRFQ
jgi:hypothetical protein